LYGILDLTNQHYFTVLIDRVSLLKQFV
jgi:hypothetical protein